jgi:hypothetical protein
MKRIITYLKIIGVVFFILFEEILWRKIGKPLHNKIKSLKIIIRFKEWVNNIEHRYSLLMIFLTPVLIDIILSYMFGIAMAHALIFAAIGIYVLKAIASVIMFLIFNIAKKRLTSFTIIKYSYYYILRIKSSRIFRKTRKYINEIKKEFYELKNSYFDGDSELFIELSKIYKNIKNIKV